MTKQHSNSVVKIKSMNESDALLRQFVGYRMKRIYMLIQEDMTRVLEPFGLRIGTFSALAVLMDSPGISQTQLSRILNIKRSGVVVVVDELENVGALERRPVANDRRVYALHVTSAGITLWERAERAVQGHETAMFSELDTDDIEQLQMLLGRAIKSVSGRGESDKK
ncbi:hypothetical protein GCM10008927_05600 [Amylibacter ulvae]|uniref:HTH marR-type domain-containing protein n=1 Tax=Paramylibacter ulvae TaxID=1651968 RepID=A0ABQ3CTY0_9RHOB|nr:MarR family transcriptional regulator [Amylibacter ulvae]GHA43749.1 hypothetical protein GCM10008927_05600 [Amylibacter ulvae]